MNINLNSILIRDIFKDFTNGNALWAIARLNEYTSPNSLLRKSILKRFSNEIKMVNVNKEVVNKLIKGFKLNDLNYEESESIKTVSRNRSSERKIIIKNISFRERRNSILSDTINFDNLCRNAN